MNLLALETSTESCSVALLAGPVLIVRSEIAPRRHAELLLPMCDAVLAEAGIARRQLDAIAVGRGPGAFTGVRLAISAAQGIALALELPVIPVSSLAALALAAPDDGVPILAVIDARMGEVYAGCFRRGSDGQLDPIGLETVGPANAIAVPRARAWNVVGTGWDVHREAIIARLGVQPAWAEGQRFPQADAIARLALPLLRNGYAVPADSALPVYLRDKVAFTTRERADAAALRSP